MSDTGSPATRESFRLFFETANVNFPVQIAADDKASVIDADGRLVCVVDVNRERPDTEAYQIALGLVLAMNACGGFAKA